MYSINTLEGLILYILIFFVVKIEFRISKSVFNTLTIKSGTGAKSKATTPNTIVFLKSYVITRSQSRKPHAQLEQY